jgi:TetR/AcrR family transcriptional regulator, transcriptional repressor for nem operon
MPYTAEHKARTRARIVASARVLFNRHGFDQVSIDDIMKQSGLTRGGFYSHFASKDALYAEAINSFATCNPFALETARIGGWSSPREGARRLAELYLSDAVLDDVEQHCPLIALPSDCARAGLAPREAYTFVVRRMLQVFRAAFGATDRDAGMKAELIVNLCVGSMVIARTTTDPTLRQSLRAAALKEARRLLDDKQSTNQQRRRVTHTGGARS